MRGLSHTIGRITLTDAQQQACAWLQEHSGTGLWTKCGTLLAAGEIAPVVRSTWNVLRDLGCVDFVSGRVNILTPGYRFAILREFEGRPAAGDVAMEDAL